jgi:UDP-N-acetylglucosamine--N-acetylmuramyl-(pentapeptide) pyrophosphoryl-undecaprenol N-acetylglucosamine transferase
MEKFFPAQKILMTGNPVRASIAASTVSRENGAAYFGLNPENKIVLSVGGSLGAKSINEALDDKLDAFEKNDLQLIWQTGKPYAEKAKQSAAGKKGIWVNEFITAMEFAYAAADLVISRSGAMAISELCVMGKPVVFVPYPFAAEDHQTVNAQNLVNKNAALMIKDKEAFDQLVPAIIELAKNEQQQNELKTNISKLAVSDADMIIAKEILNSIS